MHNGRLANPLDPHTQAIAAISRKRNKTLEDFQQLAVLEARGGMWETEDGKLGLPIQNIWRSFYDAAKGYKLGEDVKRALLCEPTVAPLTIEGEIFDCDEYLASATNGKAHRLLYTPVVVNRRRTMRARTVVPAGWTCTATFTLMTEILEPGRLSPVFERAGKYVGVGDWRPTYGTYVVEVAGVG
jgi:hypothetical protein